MQWEVDGSFAKSAPGILGLAMKKGGIESIPTWGVLALCVTALICFGIDRINNGISRRRKSCLIMRLF